jgi:formiminoglutamase
MEGAQSRLAEVVANVVRTGHRPLILGGGHETAWGTFQGIVAAKPDASVGVINIDAHLDLRADEPGNSGTPFNQIAAWCAAHGRPCPYLCIGVAQPSNTAASFERLGRLGGGIIPDTAFVSWEREKPYNFIDLFTHRFEQIHLSVDFDVLTAATMPAVSAPAVRGIQLEAVEAILQRILVTNKVAAVDLVELNPAYDIDTRGTRVAAGLVYRTAYLWE